jgi:hypothetical protein
MQRRIVGRIRRRRILGIGRHLVASGDAGEMGEERLRGGISAEPEVWHREYPAQGPPRAAGVHNEPGPEAQGPAAPMARQGRGVRLQVHALERRVVEILGAKGDGLLHQEVVDIGAQPMRVRQFVARARRHEQLRRSSAVGVVRSTVPVLEIGEAALQTAAHVRICALPRAVCGDRPQPRQVVAIRELFEEDARERRCRLTDREPRMPPALHQRDAQP